MHGNHQPQLRRGRQDQVRAAKLIPCTSYTGNTDCDLICRIPDGKPPRFPLKPTIRQAGELLVMQCVLEANPAPDITWFQGEKIMSERRSRVRMSRKATGKDTYLLTLEISNPKREDGGHYRCNAFNSYGESNANILLNFQGMLRTFRSLCHFSAEYPTVLVFVYYVVYCLCIYYPTVVDVFSL